MRYLDKCIIKDLKTHMVLLSGPRQCGKTTFSKWLLENEDMGEYFNWDQIKDRKKIIKQEWNENSKLLVLDEAQKLSKLSKDEFKAALGALKKKALIDLKNGKISINASIS